MKEIADTRIREFKYDTREEREHHVRAMESQGYECTGQIRKSDNSLMDENREYYWYGQFYKKREYK